MVNDLILLNESIKTSISVPSNLFDMTGQWCPPGNYYFLINYVGPHQFKGELNCRGFKAEYTFASKDIIHMMAIAQARLARRANITDDGMPSYRSPNTSPINNYPPSLVSHNYNNLQPPHTSPTIRQHRRRLPPTNQRPICTICLDSLNDNPKELPCSHRFHLPCITRWYSNRRTCPVCRQRFTLRQPPITANRRISRYAVSQIPLPRQERALPNTRQPHQRRIRRSTRNQTSLPSLIS